MTTLPAGEEILCRFVAFLAEVHMSYGAVRSYLSAVRHLHIIRGYPDPSSFSHPRLEYVLKGLRRREAARPRSKRLPITPDILRKIHEAWSQSTPCSDKVMLWAAFCLGFFGFLRAAEFTYHPQSELPDLTLTAQDICIDSREAPSHMQVTLKTSKTDPFGAGFVLHLGRTQDVVCPVVAMLGYLALRPQLPGFLFRFSDGSHLTRERLGAELKRALQEAKVETRGYSGHSFRIGAATVAAQKGFSDSLIQTLGRWKSSAFLEYIRTDVATLVGTASSLAA